jgi:SAM-dependent methyltransferase
MRRGRRLNPSRVWLDREIEAFAASLAPGALVLDAGAGDQVYRPKFQRQEYESADFEQVDKPYAKSTYVCDITQIPVEDGRFDAVLFSQVMEHLPEPRLAIRELRRVLKPGGKLFYSAPLFYEEHEVPYDYFRYTQFAIRMMFEEAEFSIERLDWLEGYLGTLNYQLRRMVLHLPFRPNDMGGGFWAWFTLLSFIPLAIFASLTAHGAARCDARRRVTDTGFPLNYLAIMTAKLPPETDAGG